MKGSGAGLASIDTTSNTVTAKRQSQRKYSIIRCGFFQGLYDFAFVGWLAGKPDICRRNPECKRFSG